LRKGESVGERRPEKGGKEREREEGGEKGLLGKRHLFIDTRPSSIYYSLFQMF
jgi:hypothetical protein